MTPSLPVTGSNAPFCIILWAFYLMIIVVYALDVPFDSLFRYSFPPLANKNSFSQLSLASIRYTRAKWVHMNVLHRDCVLDRAWYV